MLHIALPSLRILSSAIAFALLLFIFLVNFPNTAAARPPHSNPNTSAISVNKSPNLQAAIIKATTPRDVHINLASYDSFGKKLQLKAPTIGSRIGVHAASFDSFDWVKAAIKSFLVSVWTSIHTHAGGSPGTGGHCS